MSSWRFLGDLPQPRTQEEIKTLSLDGWKPWRRVWNRCEEPGIVVPDPVDSKRFRHVPTYWFTDDGQFIKFAADFTDLKIWRFFVPAAPTDEGAFEARTPRYEGFWRSRLAADENLPWPEAELNWGDRAAFLEALDCAETEAEKVAYRGYSRCRICGCNNGFQSFRLDVWEWPSGFRHYVAEHEVRPSRDFELFIQNLEDNQLSS